MRTKEVAEICGVSIPTVTENAKRIGKEIKNGVPTDWTDDEVKELQLVLMNNTTKRGGAETIGKVVESTALNAFKGGLSLQVIMQSGNMEACKELCQMITDGTKAQYELMIEQQKNQILIEQKEALRKEVDKYAQWMSASQIKKEYKLPSRPGITTVALELGFERGKDWIEKQYNTDCVYTKKLYSPEAVDRIVEYFYGE